VFSLSFSPDCLRIAAVVGQSAREQYVLILDAANPESNQKKIQVNPNMWVSNSARVSWSSSGQQVLFNKTIGPL